MAAPAGGAGAGGDGGGSAANDEVMELLDKLKKASKAPEQAARRIRALDAMIMRLKTNRRTCQEMIDKDTETLKWADHAEAQVRLRLDPLQARLAEREETAEHVRKQIEQAVNQFGSVISTSASRITTTRMTVAGHSKKQAIEGLRAERGFSAARGDAPHRSRPKGVIKR